MTFEKPRPHPNPDTRAFWENCRNHRLTFQRCTGCGHVRWPAAIICSQCHSALYERVASCGKGTVFSYVVYHHALHPAFQDEVPYVVAVVQLEEGPRFLSNIIGCEPDAVVCDMPVKLLWEDITEEFSLPKFQPLSPG